MNAIYSDYSPIFLYVDKYRFSKNWGYPGATVPYSLIRYVISGRAVFSLGDTSYEVGPDDVFYIPQGSVLSCAAKEEIAFISIRFVGSVQLADTDMLCALWNVPFLHNFSDMPEMWTYFERAYASALTKTTFKYLAGTPATVCFTAKPIHSSDWTVPWNLQWQLCIRTETCH